MRRFSTVVIIHPTTRPPHLAQTAADDVPFDLRRGSIASLAAAVRGIGHVGNEMASAPKAAQVPLVEERGKATFVDREIVVRIWVDQQVRQGKISAAKAHEFWLKHGHDYLENVKSWFPIAKDSRSGAQTLRTIISELGVFGRYYLKTYRGREHVIFKGYAGARKFLTGTRYGLEHSKIISLKMTKAGFKDAAHEGLVFGLIFCTVLDIVDYATSDHMTLGELFGTVGTDIVKVLAVTGASYLAAVGTAALMGTAVIAIGPVVAGLVVGIGLAIVLDMLDKHFGVTKKLGELCDEGLHRLEAMAARARAEGIAAWHNVENSRVVRDLSCEAHDVANWIGRQASSVNWAYGFL